MYGRRIWACGLLKSLTRAETMIKANISSIKTTRVNPQKVGPIRGIGRFDDLTLQNGGGDSIKMTWKYHEKE